MLTFTPKMSGTRVEGFNIPEPLFTSQFISLTDCITKVKRQETMNWLLDTLRFSRGDEVDGKIDWYAIIDWDSVYKLTILESYPEYEKEMISYFGEGWLKQYIRFNH